GAETQAPTPKFGQDLPTRSGLARLPRALLQRALLEPSDVGLDAAFLRAIHGIQLIGEFLTTMFRQVVGKGSRVETAPRYAEALAQRFRRLEQLVRNRERYFHTAVLPR